MKSKLNRICVVVERNNVIEKIVHDYFRDLKGKVKVDNDYLERQIVSWSYFDVGNENEEIFFKVYVQRYLSHPEISKRFKFLNSDEISALLVIRINDENKKKVLSMLDLSFHDSINNLNNEIAKVEYMSIIRYKNKMREQDLISNSEF